MNINAKATPLRGVCDGRLATPQGTSRSSDASDVSNKAFLKDSEGLKAERPLLLCLPSKYCNTK